jgi:hypothetical protein
MRLEGLRREDIETDRTPRVNGAEGLPGGTLRPPSRYEVRTLEAEPSLLEGSFQVIDVIGIPAEQIDDCGLPGVQIETEILMCC